MESKITDRIDALELLLFAAIKASKISNDNMLEELGELRASTPKDKKDLHKELTRLADLFCTVGSPFCP